MSNNIDSSEASSSSAVKSSTLSVSPQIQRQALIGRLTSNIVHELNNPMQAIRGSAALALEDLSNADEIEQYLKIIRQSSDRAISLINLVHSIYAPCHSAPSPIDLQKLFQVLMPIFKDDLNHKGLILQVIPLEQPIFIWGIESTIQLSVLNLILFINEKLAKRKKKSFSICFEQSDTQGSLRILLPIEFFTNEEWNHEDFQYSIILLKEMRGVFSSEVHEGRSNIRVSFPLAFPKAGSNGSE